VLASAPPAALAVRGAAALAAEVRCPGAAPAPGGGAYQSCANLLPSALVLALLPRGARAASAPAPPAQQRWSSARWLRLGVKRCPWCGAASQLSDGCSSVRCAVCLRDWCFACGRRLSHAHELHRGCAASQAMDVLIHVLVALMLAALALVVRGAHGLLLGGARKTCVLGDDGCALFSSATTRMP
jgi:hypothetical protein